MSKIRTRHLLLGSTIVAGAALLSSGSHAQTSVAAPDAQRKSSNQTVVAAADVPDDIVVTGSRIQRLDIDSAVPVTVVSADAIQQTGAANIQDTLAELPSVGQNISRATSNFSTNGNGVATVNLRNLGNSRTLVLIDGRRSVGIAGTSAVDLNNIPTDFIERIEIVTGGASAVYGSEAIAGVVNFVLKDKFEGIRLRAQNTISDKGDSPREFATLTAGQSFGGDKGNIIVNFSYDNDHGLRSRDRSFSRTDTPNRSSFAAQGLFSVDGAFSPANGKTFTFDPSNNVKPYQGANIDGYNRDNDRYLSLPVERYSGALLGNYALTPGITAYIEGEYTKSKSNAGLEPLAVGSSGTGAVLNFDGTPFLGIPITNPFIPAQIKAAMVAAGTDYLQFRRRSNDIFSRSNKDDRDYYRGVVGVKGDLFGDFKFDAYYEHSESKDHTQAGNILATNYGAALNAVRDASGNIVCADAVARAAGCVPINIFGYNTVSAAAAKFLQTDAGPALGGVKAGNPVLFTYDARVRQDVGDATVTGSLFRLPGGPFSVAFGGEYRRESSSEVYDPYSQAGIGLGNQLSNTVGSFNVKEGFLEVNAPMLKDRPFFHYLGFEGAVRYADYSTVGGVTSYKGGVEYAPIADIRFRGVYARATRAPNIGELFSAQSQTFPAVTDPCDQRRGAGDYTGSGNPFPSPLPAACAAIPGIARTVAANGGFAYTTAQIQTIDGLVGGNPNLKAETADTLTLGAVLTPSFARNFTLSVDYYRIKVRNAVGIIGQQVSADQCIQGGGPVFCANVIRDANGFITRINAINLNTGSTLVSGLDIQGRLHADLASIKVPGALDFSMFWNHLFQQQQTPFPGGPVQNELGQADCYSCGRLGSGLRDKINASVVFTTGGFSFNYRLDYLSPLVDSLDADTPIHIPAYTYHNIQVRQAVGEKREFQFYLGVNNLFDKKPPIFADTNPVTWPGTQTVASTYDTLGRLLYAGVEVKF